MEAIFIFYQCKIFIGVISAAAVAIGNIQQNYQDEFAGGYGEIPVVDFEIGESENTENKNEDEREDDWETEAYETAMDYEEYYEPESEGVFDEDFDSSFKAYMDYRCITDTGSVQYEMQQQAYTDSRGFRRIGDDYCVALGTGFTYGCGERFSIYLDSGYCFNAVVSDVKSDAHTDPTNCYVPRGENSGNVVEFIIDTDYADSSMLCSGSAGYYEDLSGNITAVVPI